MKGTIKADFAGSFSEAEEFAKANGLTVARHPKDFSEFPLLCYRFDNRFQAKEGIKKFNEVGFATEFLIARIHGKNPRTIRADALEA